MERKGNYHKIKDKGFDKNPQNINRTGANRKTVSSVILELKENGVEQVKAKQVTDLFESLLNCNKAELTAISNDGTQPILNQIVAKAMLDKKGFEIVEKMLDRIHGKAIQKTENTEKMVVTELNEIDYSKLKTETIEKIMKDLNE